MMAHDGTHHQVVDIAEIIKASTSGSSSSELSKRNVARKDSLRKHNLQQLQALSNYLVSRFISRSQQLFARVCNISLMLLESKQTCCQELQQMSPKFADSCRFSPTFTMFPCSDPSFQTRSSNRNTWITQRLSLGGTGMKESRLNALNSSYKKCDSTHNKPAEPLTVHRILQNLQEMMQNSYNLP